MKATSKKTKSMDLAKWGKLTDHFMWATTSGAAMKEKARCTLQAMAWCTVEGSRTESLKAQAFGLGPMCTWVIAAWVITQKAVLTVIRRLGLRCWPPRPWQTLTGSKCSRYLDRAPLKQRIAIRMKNTNSNCTLATRKVIRKAEKLKRLQFKGARMNLSQSSTSTTMKNQLILHFP